MGMPLAPYARMHLVAFGEAPSHQWRWRIVDEEGNELAHSPTVYSSISEALEAGRERYNEVLRKRPPFVVRSPWGGRRRVTEATTGK
jgi:hypothetical protein